jgi:hypothetical protein
MGAAHVDHQKDVIGLGFSQRLRAKLGGLGALSRTNATLISALL